MKVVHITFNWLRILGRGHLVGYCSSNIYLNIIFTKEISFRLPSFSELGYFALSFGGEMLFRQESIDSLWVACSVHETFNLVGMDSAPEL
jgi:hypothetical protein